LAKKPKDHEAESAAEALLKVRHPRAAALLDAVHAVNPTARELAPEVEARRYALKSRLQSQLILDHFDDLEFIPTKEEPGVLTIWHRPLRRDACHAIVSQLSLDARSKVLFFLDTHAPTPASIGPTTTPRMSRAPDDGVRQGRLALKDYDFEKARACFERAVEEGAGEEAAVALLELLVDTLAAWTEALELVRTLPALLMTPPVCSLLAVAAAQTGDAALCLQVAGEHRGPRLAAAFCQLAARALAAGDASGAAQYLAEARTRDPSAPELVQVEADLAKVRAKLREPEEGRLQALVDSGHIQTAEAKANEILAQWPDSAFARRTLRDLEATRARQRAESLVLQGQAAFDRGDDAQALAAWGEALALGVTHLESKLATAHERQQATLGRRRVEEAIEALRTVNAESLTAFLRLEASERSRVVEQTKLRILSWLERLDSGSPREWPRHIAAVIALEEASSLGLSAQTIVERLRPHETEVNTLAEGRALLQHAENALERASLLQAEAQLELARTALAEDRPQDVIELLQAPGLALHAESAPLRRAAHERLEEVRQVKRYDELFERGQVLEALQLVNAQQRKDSSDQALWTQRRQHVTVALRRFFQFQVSRDPSDLKSCDFTNLFAHKEVQHELDDAGTFLFWVSGYGRRCYVRKFSVETQAVVEIASFLAPATVRFPEVMVSDEGVWFWSDGSALLLSPQTWDVLAWQGPSFLKAGEILEQQLTVPGGRYHWLSVRHQEERRESIRIIDAWRSRIHREASKDGISLSLLPGAEPRVFLSGHFREGKVFSAGGTVEMTVSNQARELAIATDQKGWLAVLVPDDTENESLGNDEPMRVVQLNMEGGAIKAVGTFPDSFIDGACALATSRSEGVTFLMHDATNGSGKVTAFKQHEGRFSRLWEVDRPRDSRLAVNVSSSKVVLAYPDLEGVRCLALGVEAPPIEAGFSKPFERIPRMLSSGSLHCGPWLDLGLTQEAKPVHLEKVATVRQERVRSLCETHRQNPEALAFFAHEFRSWRQHAEAERFRAEAVAHFPRHPATLLEAAGQAFQQSDWQTVLSTLASIGLEGLPPKARAHGQHLKALAQFQVGQLDAAKSEFVNLERLEGACDVSGWVGWIDALQGRGSGKAAQLVKVIREADLALETGNSSRALECLDCPSVWDCVDIQLGARMASAVLACELKTRVRPRMMLDEFLSSVESQISLPLGALAWSSDRIAQLAVAARRALGDPEPLP
jgi:hypothetical protein